MSKRIRFTLEHTFPIPPGNHIRRWMDSVGVNPTEFSRMMALSTQSVHALLKGEQSLTPETAYKLELVTGANASFWTKLESNYHLALLRERALEEEVKTKAWIKSFPIADLRNRGALPLDFAKLGTIRQRECLLQFFGVANEKAYAESFNKELFAARTVRGLKSDEPALMAWVQLGRREAGKIETPAFDADKFKLVLASIPRKTLRLESPTENVADWLLRLRERCREAGVALVFIRPLRGVRHVNGAAHWIREKPVIQLSLHGKSIDRILFSFCHEAGHILDQRHRLSYVTCEEDDEAERDADSAAANILLPGLENDQLKATRGNLFALKELANAFSVYSGIVFGRYCKLTGYQRKNLNLLSAIRKFEWPNRAAWQLA